MTKESDSKRPITKTVVKAPSTSPGETLKVKLAKDAKVEYLRIFVGGPDGETPYEIILHRPVGKTNLAATDWVSSSPANFQLLLTRSEDPEEKNLLLKRMEHKKKAAVDDGKIKIDSTGVVKYPSGTNRNEFLEPFRKKVKELVKDRNRAIDDWKKADGKTRSPTPPSKLKENDELLKLLSLDSRDDSKAELAFAKFMNSEKVTEDAEKAFPQNYETKGGTYMELPQVALGWANGLTKEQLQQDLAKFIAILFGRDIQDLGSGITGHLGSNLKIGPKKAGSQP
jgi:hypothetical protein